MSDAAQTNLAFGRKFFDAIFEGDWDYLAANVTDDFKVHEADGMPYRGVYEGIPGFQKLFAAMSTEYYDNLDIKLLDMAATEDRILAHWILTGTAKPTGNPVEVTIAEVTMLKDGKVDSIWPHYWDTKAVAEAFGE